MLGLQLTDANDTMHCGLSTLVVGGVANQTFGRMLESSSQARFGSAGQ